LLAFVIIGLIILPFLNIINNLNSGFTRPFYRFLCFLFFINYIILGILGAQAVVSPFVVLGRICTVVFFSFFIIIFFIGLLEFSFSVIKNIKN
jgi:ubiquinol-cytochrome c reductase cytochrome b subunit